MTTVGKVVLTVGALVAFLFVAVMFEASFGHDGLLCDWGYDRDGAGTRITGCS